MLYNKVMRQLRKPTECDSILNMFDVVGIKHSIEYVLDVAGVKNYNSLKALFSYIRKAPHIPDENRIDVRISEGMCKRVK